MAQDSELQHAISFLHGEIQIPEKYEDVRLDKKRNPPTYYGTDVVEGEDWLSWWIDDWARGDEERLELLFELHGLEGDHDYRSLCIALARQFIPGFQYRARNRKHGRDLPECRRLVGLVALELRKPSMTKSAVFERLVGEGGAYFQHFEESKDAVEAVTKQYARAKRYLWDAGYPDHPDPAISEKLLQDYCIAFASPSPDLSRLAAIAGGLSVINPLDDT